MGFCGKAAASVQGCFWSTVTKRKTRNVKITPSESTHFLPQISSCYAWPCPAWISWGSQPRVNSTACKFENMPGSVPSHRPQNKLKKRKEEEKKKEGRKKEKKWHRAKVCELTYDLMDRAKHHLHVAPMACGSDRPLIRH